MKHESVTELLFISLKFLSLISLIMVVGLYLVLRFVYESKARKYQLDYEIVLEQETRQLINSLGNAFERDKRKRKIDNAPKYYGVSKANLVEQIISLKISGYWENYHILCSLGFIQDKWLNNSTVFPSDGNQPLWNIEFLLKQDESILKNLYLSLTN